MTDRSRGRGDQQPKPGRDQLAAWRRALADHNRASRIRRGKRPAKPITGIRVPRPKE